MSFLHATASTVRIFQRFRESNPQSGTGLQYAWSLLQEILRDEGHATDLLREFDVSSDSIQERTLSIGHKSQNSNDEISLLEWQRLMMRAADRLAIEYAEDGLTGSEHVLLALSQLEVSIGVLLSEQGLTESGLVQSLQIPQSDLSVPDGLQVQIKPAEVGHVDAASLSRILDANANRCREGLRVVEDYVRFHLDDAILQRELKQIRHQLTDALRHLGQEYWIPLRDTEQDVGQLSSLASERSRSSLLDVVRANMKRIEESLRTLEEYGKLIDAEVAHSISKCRYRIYTVEKGLESVSLNRHRLEKSRLYLLVTAANSRYSPEILIKNALESGVDVIQIREKGMTDLELIRYGRLVRTWTSAAGALLIMNDRPDLAVAIGADGVHLGQDDLDVASARKILGGQGMIGVSTHSLEQARAAVFDGADYLGVGPVFQSQTKEFEEFAGLEYVETAANHLGIPWFAIGGIHAGNLGEVLRAGARRIAVSSVISQAPHPRGVADELKSMLNSAVKIDELRGKGASGR